MDNKQEQLLELEYILHYAQIEEQIQQEEQEYHKEQYLRMLERERKEQELLKEVYEYPD